MQQGTTSTSNKSDVRNGLLAIVDEGVVSGTRFITAVILGRSFSPGAVRRILSGLDADLRGAEHPRAGHHDSLHGSLPAPTG